jgi:Mg-chelatase subunit ChlI/Mg-chelatase subunit ChlD
MSFSYPFCAVVGQEPFKLALLLAAIEPAIGGVLVRGPRGVAKTTLARALAELTPGRFVELPLGATEERVTGTLDLEGALRDGKLEFAPGLLARAHDGVLYVDEVNLLPDAIVDVLLGAAASGVNVVERDGVSHRHPARFVLVGTMNPDEGELRPQHIDRFGLAVNASAKLGPAERAEIVMRRLDFDHDPEAFVARHAEAQRTLIERCNAARARAQAIPLAGAALGRVSERCYAAGVEGVRADLAMLRAARAHAAWHGRSQIEEADIEAVAELALSHRRSRDRDPNDGGPGGSGAHGAGGATPGPASSQAATSRGGAGNSAAAPRPRHQAAHAAASSGGRSNATAGTRVATEAADSGNHTQAGALSLSERAASGSDSSAAVGGAADRGALPAVPVRAVKVVATPSWLNTPKQHARRARSSQLQHRVRHKTAPQPSRSIDWFATLANSRRPNQAQQRQKHRSPPSPLTAPAPSDAHIHVAKQVSWDIRYRRRPMTRALTVVALDCSASMLRGGALAAAKGVARALLTAPGSARTELALIAFTGAQASACIARASGPRLDRAVAQLGAGGGTPLRRALIDALALGRRADQRGATYKRLLLFTDGRTREPTSDLKPLREAFDVSVIDCERTRVRLGRARAIAHELDARYTHIDQLLLAEDAKDTP